MEGVSAVEVDVRARRVRVPYEVDRLDEARVREALEGAGFAVE